MSSARVSLVCVALLLSIAGCGGKASVNQASAPPCATRVPAAHPADMLTVVVFDKIDMSHAPWPQNRSERFVFSHLYETLVNIDCRGQVQPGIAKSWKEASDGWYIEIKEDAHFWDDTMVTAADVQARFNSFSGFPIVADIVDETHVIVHGVRDIKLLALPMLAICKQSASGTATIGTGPWQVDTVSSSSSRLMLRPSSGDAPVAIFQREDHVNATDILNGSVDAMITDDPAVIDYARTKERAKLSPFPWDTVYMWIDPARVAMAAAGKSVTDLPRTFCDALARDVVPVDSRCGSDIFSEGWRALPFCVRGYDDAPGPATGKEVLFEATDPSARALGERMVALAAMDTSVSPDARAMRRAMPGASKNMRATGVSHEELMKRLQSLNDAGYVVPLSSNTCYPKPGNTAAAVGLGMQAMQQYAHALIPLVETRAHFIVLSDRVSYSYDESGNVRLIPPGVERVR